MLRISLPNEPKNPQISSKCCWISFFKLSTWFIYCSWPLHMWIVSAGHKDSVTCVGFNHDCSLVVTGDMAGLIKVWSVDSQQEVWAYEVDDLEVSSLSVIILFVFFLHYSFFSPPCHLPPLFFINSFLFPSPPHSCPSTSFHMKCEHQTTNIRSQDHVWDVEVTCLTGLGPVTCRWNSLFGHVARPAEDTPAHQDLWCQADLSLGHPPDQGSRRCPGRPRSRWLDQLHRDLFLVSSSTVPPFPLLFLLFPFLQGVSGSCKPCTSYDRDVRLSVCHTLALCENEAD